MKRLVTTVALVSMLTIGAGAGTARAVVDDPYDDSFTHPLSLAYYVIHPVGFALEWLVGRPFHYLVSRPYADKVFGYRPLGSESAYRKLGDRM